MSGECDHKRAVVKPGTKVKCPDCGEMVGMRLPNIRQLFIPDPGYIMAEADLSGADAQVVAWEAEDEDLKAAFRAGLKVHDKNATDMWGSKYTELPGHYSDSSTPKGKLYKKNKQGVHSTNYLVSAKSLAMILGWTVAETQRFQKGWFTLHPAIKQWHIRVRRDLETSRMVKSAFGYRCPFFDRIETSLTDAVAWVPQHTVAIVCFRGALQLQKQLPWIELLLQVHDSLVFQFPRSRLSEIVKIRESLTVPVPYPDPLIIPWELKLSTKSWGDCQDVKWDEEEDQIWKKIAA